jgi:hypothetical protein
MSVEIFADIFAKLRQHIVDKNVVNIILFYVCESKFVLEEKDDIHWLSIISLSKNMPLSININYIDRWDSTLFLQKACITIEVRPKERSYCSFCFSCAKFQIEMYLENMGAIFHDICEKHNELFYIHKDKTYNFFNKYVLEVKYCV